MSTTDRTDPATARAHAITLLAADEERVQRLERDLARARRDLVASRLLAAACGVTGPRELSAAEHAVLTHAAGEVALCELRPGDLWSHGDGDGWALVSRSRPWGSRWSVDHAPMVAACPAEPWAAGVIGDPAAVVLRVVADDRRVALMTTEQAAAIQSVERVMRADGFEPKLTTHDLLSNLEEFAEDYDFAADPLGAHDGAIIVFRDPEMEDRFSATGEHMVPDEGLIIQPDGTTGPVA